MLSWYNPANQIKCMRNAERCIVGTSPTINDIRLNYGRKAASVWLEIQIRDFSEYVGGSMNEFQFTSMSAIIIERFGYIKLTEIMLFFANLKSGMYGKFYGRIAPIDIMEKFRMFMQYRNDVLDAKVASDVQSRIESERNDTERLTLHEWQCYRPWMNAGYSISRWRAHRAALSQWWGEQITL